MVIIIDIAVALLLCLSLPRDTLQQSYAGEEDSPDISTTAMSTASAVVDNRGGVIAAVLVALFVSGVLVAIVTVVVLMVLGRFRCCPRRREQVEASSDAVDSVPIRRQNSSLFKVLVNRNSNLQYGTTATTGDQQAPNSNKSDSRELSAHYEMLSDSYDTSDATYDEPGSGIRKPNYSIPKPNGASQVGVSNSIQQRVEYEYVDQPSRHYEFDESLAKQDTEKPHYEFDESMLKTPKDSAVPRPSLHSAMPLPQDGRKVEDNQVTGPATPTVQHYAVSYAAPTLTRTMEFTDVSKNVYREPASDTPSLYAQFKAFDISVISTKDLQVTDFLGAGQFGKVHKGVWQSPNGVVEIAVKTLNEGAKEVDKVKFLQEAAIMGQFSHPNVVKLYGVATSSEPIQIVLELLPKGDLRNALIGLRKEVDGRDETNNQLSYKLLSYCRQISSAMCYLSSKAFVHRDLAARNILVAENGACKVADFGMSRVCEAQYYISHGGQIPVKWTAPEALHFRKYSTASDVWSFGIVMYEIWSLGHKPFESLDNMQALKKVTSGVRLAPPPGCPRAIYTLMIKCWHPVTSERPSFMEVVRHLAQSNSALLTWSVLEQSLYPDAMKLGANLKVAKKLHRDLQESYKK